MKNIIFALSLVLTMAFSANAQMDGFFRNSESGIRSTPGTDEPIIPHGAVGSIKDQDAAPLGSGLLVLTALGAGYAWKRREKNQTSNY